MMFLPLLLIATEQAVPAPVVMIPPAPPAAGMARLPVTAPTPRGGSLISLFSPDDFPAALQGKKAPRGIVNLRLFVDASGHAYACALRATNAEDLLVRETCELLQRRASFTPAVDAGGVPTSGLLDVEVDWDAVYERSIIRIRD
jgi:protein TonB